MARLPLALHLLSLSLAFGFAATVPLAAPVSDGGSPSHASLEKLAEGVLLSIGDPQSDSVSNAGVIVLDSCLALFDTQFTPDAGKRLLGAIGAETAKPVRYIIYSHFHPDHTHGTQSFPQAFQILSGPGARRDILQKDIPSMSRMLGVAQTQAAKLGKDLSTAATAGHREGLKTQLAARQEFIRRMSNLNVRPPLLTIDDNLVIRDGDREVRVLYLGRGHTDSDLILFLPAEKIVFLSDLFFNRAIPNIQDAFILEWIGTLRRVLELPADRFVPGQGPAGTRKDVELFLSYLEDLRTGVEEAIGRGDALETILREARLPEKYASFTSPEFYPANLQKVYAELRSLQSPAPPESPKAQAGKPAP